ncbi:CGNR zinc finger domain-containing protein [Actinomadura sp. 6N118]|uniref:CGNR zinc finger domain-containing protein n=1 Tax=Actinomadura sp. 6N118 TaxID=3375151 RepID=UPI00378C7203
MVPPADPEDVTGLPADVALVHAFVNTLDLREYRVHGQRMRSHDAWESPEALERWLREHQLLTTQGPADAHDAADAADAADLERAQRLRSILRDSTRQSTPGGTTPPDDASPQDDTSPQDGASPQDDASPPDNASPPDDTWPQDDASPQDGTSQLFLGNGALLTEFPLIASAGQGTGIRLVPADTGVSAALTRVLITAVELSARGLWARLKMCPADDCQWIFFDRSRPGRGRWCSPQLCGNRVKIRAYRQRRQPALEPETEK